MDIDVGSDPVTYRIVFPRTEIVKLYGSKHLAICNTRSSISDLDVLLRKQLVRFIRFVVVKPLLCMSLA